LNGLEPIDAERIYFAEFSSATVKGVIFCTRTHERRTELSDVSELEQEDMKANALIAAGAREVLLREVKKCGVAER